MLATSLQKEASLGAKTVTTGFPFLLQNNKAQTIKISNGSQHPCNKTPASSHKWQHTAQEHAEATLSSMIHVPCS